MNKAIFLSSVTLADGQYRVEALRVGHWEYPGIEGGFEITPQILREMKANFDAGAKGYEVPLNLEHEDERSCGWVKGLELSDDGQHLFARFEIQDEDTRKRVDEKKLKYCSSEIDLAWFDPEAKRTLRVIEGLALTNRPYIKRMQPIQPLNLSEFAANDHQEETMPKTLAEAEAEIASLKAQLSDKQVGSDPKLTELQAQLNEAKARDEAQRARLAELEKVQRETSTKLRMTEVRTRLTNLVKRGKLTVPAYKKVLALAETLVSEDRAVIQLAAKRKLDEGGAETDKLDVVDSVLDILNQLPDSIATDSGNDKAELDEDGPSSDDPSESDDDKLDREARAAMKEDPKLTYRQAVRLAEKKLKEGK